MLFRSFVNRFLKKMDTICVSSKSLLNTTPYLGQFRDKIEEVSYFINEKRFSNLSAPDPGIIELTKTMQSYALFAGVLRWYKGLDILLDAAKKIDNHIVIVGKGDLYNKLESRIKKENLKNVHLLGFQDDKNLKFLIECSRLIVLPSIAPAEAFGQILLEGLYFSKPLVSTELGTGTSLVNRHNHTGFVVKPGCSDSLARAMNRIGKEDACYEKFSKNAFHHYLDNYTAAAQGDKYIRIYRSFLS